MGAADEAVQEAANAAYRVVLAADSIHLDAFLYDPDSRLNPAGDSKECDERIALTIAKHAQALFEALTSLDSHLRNGDVWLRLCEANREPATIGGKHGPCYAEAAFRFGDEIYSSVLRAQEPTHSVPHDCRLSDLPVLTAEKIISRPMGVAAFVRLLVALTAKADVELAHEQLAKEVFRATGKINPGSETAAASRASANASHLSAELCGQLGGISTATLNAYAKAAGVNTPGRGQRNFRYSADDSRRVLQWVADSGSDAGTVKCAREALREIETKSKYRN
jgi:hypothetical protein